MPQDYLGLFDTPPTRGENRFALAVVGAVFVAFLAVLPIANVRAAVAPAFVPTVSAMLFVGDLIIAILLCGQAAVFRSRALTVLAAGHVFIALIMIPYMLTFPGAFAPDGLLNAGISTTTWLAVFRLSGSPVSIILYALLKRADAERAPENARQPHRLLASVAAAVALTVALTLLATIGHDLLPTMYLGRSETLYSNIFLFNIAMMTLLVIAIALLWQRSSVLDTWLLVSLAMMLTFPLLNTVLVARFTIGWYCLYLFVLLSHLFVLLALLAEFNRLYVRLALATAARSRERDARMMSMDGVAAAISHEIGQPLVAVSLSATAALNSLTRERPDSEKAIKSLHGTIDANQRAFAVVESTRAMFGRTSNFLSEFDLNDLVRQSASLLDREMVAHKITLRLALDETLSPILANRVHIQRVLVNLLTNAIESIGAAKPRERHIVIRSATPNDEAVRVEISDSGAGISADVLTRIFDPFFTTKPSGTGLGLSLSRTIVEDHGGRLWASWAEDGSTTFILELRYIPRATTDERAEVPAA